MAQVLGEDELLALVDRLADGQWHSGEKLAAAAGISRAALAKRIDRLGDWQLAVEARHGLGYRLAAPLARLDAARLQAAVDGALRVRVIAVTDSTSTRLLDAPAADDPQALLAEYQTAGRGRRGRTWVSPFGAQLAMSLAWSFDALPPQLATLPLAVGVACARVLRAQGLQRVGLKWPNDIVCAGRKLGGILLEHRGEGGGGCRIVAGIGINLALQPAQAVDVVQPWINLDDALRAERAPPAARNALAAELLRALAALMRDYPRSGFAPWVADWEAFDITREQPVRVLLGERMIDGVAHGVDAQGALIVEAGDERHRLHSGEVSLRLRT